MLQEEILGVFSPLSQARLAVGVKSASLLDDVLVHANVQQVAHLADALVEHDVELGHAEGSCDLVLDDASAHAAADDLRPLLERLAAAQVDTDGAIELERPAAGGDLGAAVADADLLANLVDENDRGAGTVDGGGELAEGLGHETRLHADVDVAHVALDFGLRDQGGNAVDDDGVNGAAADQLLGDVQRLLGGVGLGDQQVVQVKATAGGVVWIQGVFSVDVGGEAAHALGLGHDVDGKGGLAGRFPAVDLGNTAAGQAADAQGHVQGQRAGGNDVGDKVGDLFVATHHRALAVVFFNTAQGDLEGGQLVLVEIQGFGVDCHR